MDTATDSCEDIFRFLDGDSNKKEGAEKTLEEEPKPASESPAAAAAAAAIASDDVVEYCKRAR